jgi:hypothetical protein
MQRPALPGHLTIPLVAALLLPCLWAGCYRTNTRSEPDAAAPLPDAARPDAPLDLPDARGPDAFVVRDECARDRDCVVGLCVLDASREPVDLAPVPLRCGPSVGLVRPGQECDANEACDHGLCALAGGCVEPCLDASDCADGERCTSVPVVTSERTMQTARACVRWVDAPPGTVVVSDETLTVSRFASEELPLGAMGMPTRLALFVAGEVDEGRYVSGLRTATGEVLYDVSGLGVTRQVFPVIASQDIVPALIPNGTRDAPLGVDLVLTLETSRTSELRQIILDRPAPGRVLDVNVFYVGVEAPRAGTPPREVTEMLAQYDALLGTVDLALGRVRHLVLVGASARSFSVIEDDLEVGELFALSAGAARPALNVFLVRSGTDFLGIAGGAPGAQAVHGTRASGIAIGFEDLQSIVGMAPPDLPGTVLGHETGHFLGFFHTTELDGTVIEALDDTPVCTLAEDRDGDGMLMPDECAGHGADNVMFWGPFTPSPRFSPRQARILQNAMVLQ